MKFCSSILALAALFQSANAFLPQTPLRTTTTFGMAAADGYAQGVQQAQTFGAKQTTKTTFEKLAETDKILVQGGSLRTCSFSESADRISVYLKSEGRPLNANIDLWQGPDNTPQKITVYLEDGGLRPFSATLESPGNSNSVSIRNTGQMEFPLEAGLEIDTSGADGAAKKLAAAGNLRKVQGGAVYTIPFPSSVQSVEVMLKSDMRPLNARVELLQGPNNIKQVMEVYSEAGNDRPFYCIIDTPGNGNVVRICNTSTVEFPISAHIEAYSTDDTQGDAASPSSSMMWS